MVVTVRIWFPMEKGLLMDPLDKPPINETEGNPGMKGLVEQANREYYAAKAQDYTDGRSREEFQTRYQILFGKCWQAAAPHLPANRPVRALDCCSGSGLVTRLLLDRGVQVTAVDISSEMLKVLRDRVLRPGEQIATACCEILSFLEQAEEKYDLIVFGSALHHLWDYESVLRAAIGRLESSGLLIIVAEPILQTSCSFWIIRQAEFVLRKTARNPKDLFPAFIRKVKSWGLRRSRWKKETQPEGVVPSDLCVSLAEVHAGGLDFAMIEQVFSERGLFVVWSLSEISGATFLHSVKKWLPGYPGDSRTMVLKKS